MASRENKPTGADESDKKNAASERDHNIQETLQEEFHEVWEETIRPALEQLKETTEELLNRFSDFEDDFRGYLRDREPDVDVDLIEEIYGEKLRGKMEEQEKQTEQ